MKNFDQDKIDSAITPAYNKLVELIGETAAQDYIVNEDYSYKAINMKLLELQSATHINNYPRVYIVIFVIRKYVM